jgi:hypothetical protein
MSELLLTLLLQGGPKEITGQVVDADGKPVEGVLVASRWKAGQTLEPAAESFKSGAEGKFTCKLTIGRRPAALMAIDAEQKVGGVVVIDEKAAAEPVTIKLQPLVAVRGEIRVPDGKLPDSFELGLSALPGYVAFLKIEQDAGKFAFRAPPGEHQIYARASGPQFLPLSVKQSFDKPEVDLGVLNFEMSILGKHQDKEPPPLSISDARGVDKGVKLSDYKGKWVLMEFWGFW